MTAQWRRGGLVYVEAEAQVVLNQKQEKCTEEFVLQGCISMVEKIPTAN